VFTDHALLYNSDALITTKFLNIKGLYYEKKISIYVEKATTKNGKKTTFYES
jgi:hypothetical protein